MLRIAMTPATVSALATVFAAFLVGLIWHLWRGEFRDVWLLCVPVAALAPAALFAPDYFLWEMGGCMAAVAALTAHSLVWSDRTGPAAALGPVRDPDAADVPLPPRPARRAPAGSSRHGRGVLAALILINVAIAGAGLLRGTGWYTYRAAQSFSASERCQGQRGSGGSASAAASAPYGRQVLGVSTPDGLRGSAVFLDSPAAARAFAGDMAGSTVFHAVQRGPIVLVTARRLRRRALLRLGACLQVVEVERISDAFGAPFTRAKHPFGSGDRPHR